MIPEEANEWGKRLKRSQGMVFNIFVNTFHPELIPKTNKTLSKTAYSAGYDTLASLAIPFCPSDLRKNSKF